jgi:hypothetical protein
VLKCVSCERRQVTQFRSEYSENNCIQVLSDKPSSKGNTKKPRHRWENNIEMDLTEVRCNVVNWIHQAQDRDRWQTLVNTAMNFGVA